MIAFDPSDADAERRDAVVGRVVECIREGRTIKLPAFDPALATPASTALVTVGLEPNDFSGPAGPYRYQFEGEEDLLHLIVTRTDGATLTPEEARHVVSFLLPDVSPAFIWLRPGLVSQHFYVGHEEVVGLRS